MRAQRIDLILVASVFLVAAAAVAVAQSTDTPGSSGGTSQTQPATPDKPAAQPAQPEGATATPSAPATNPTSTAPANAAPSTSTSTPGAAISADAKAKMAAILERGGKQPVKGRTEAESKVQEAVNETNAKAVSDGNDKVAERLSGEFGMTTQAITAEKEQTGLSWGDLMIAHTLIADSDAGLTIDELNQMKKDGNGWGLIAAGMGFKLGDVVAAARAEAKVASGTAKADGKVHPMHLADASAASGAAKSGGASADVSAKPEVTDKPKSDKP